MIRVKISYLKSFFICTCFCVSLCCWGCADAEQKAHDMYELAVFEEKQFNTAHAKELYNGIIDQYPNTNRAEMAKKALIRLEKSPKTR